MASDWSAVAGSDLAGPSNEVLRGPKLGGRLKTFSDSSGAASKLNVGGFLKSVFAESGSSLLVAFGASGLGSGIAFGAAVGVSFSRITIAGSVVEKVSREKSVGGISVSRLIVSSTLLVTSREGAVFGWN